MNRQRIVAGLLAVMVAMLCWSGLLSRAVAAQEATRVLTATGQGSVSVETAIAVVRLGVIVTGDSAQQVQEQVAQRSNQLVEALKTLEVQKLQTTGISLNPQYDYNNGQAKQVGVQGQNSVQFEVAIAKAGSILDQAVAAGATQVESVSFKATEEVIASGRKAALQLAVKDAQTQAQDVLQVLSLSIKSIQKIEVNSSNALPPPVPLEKVAYARLDSAPSPVIGGDQQVTASVTLTVSY